MRVTARRMEFFRLLSQARWLLTRQVHQRFFPHATLDATRKWLRKGVRRKYLVSYQANRMSEALVTLGPEGKRVLEQAGGAAIQLERRLPKQIEHLCGINDLRIAGELTGSMGFFLACWELFSVPGVDWHHAIIPDAVFELGGQTFAMEFDRGLEGVKFFLQSKMSVYQRGLDGLPLAAVVIVTDREARMVSLMRAVAGTCRQVFFTTLNQVRVQGLTAPIFLRHEHDTAFRLF